MTSGWKAIIVIVILSLNCSECVSAASDRLSLRALCGAEALASNVNGVRRKAAGMPPPERYEYLKNWVLPSETHPDYRVVGEFTPTDPSPLAMELEPYRFGSERGGELVSPVYDLLETAKALGRLEELFDEIESLPESAGSVSLRAKLSLLIMIRFEQGKPASIEELITQLHREFSKTFGGQPPDYSPELLMLDHAPADRNTYTAVIDLLSAFHGSRFGLKIDDIWERELCTLMGRYGKYLESDGAEDVDLPGNSKHWVPVARAVSMTRGEGYPATVWRQTPNHELHLRSGHHRDYLFYATPLTGNYEVVGEVDTGGTTQIMTAGLFVGPMGDQKSINAGEFREDLLVQAVDPPLQPHGEWAPYRAVVRNQHLQVFLYERLLIDRELGPDFDPWVAARGVSHATGPIRCLQILGQPEIREAVVLSSQAAFSSWYPYYFYTEDAGKPRSRWRWIPGSDGQGEIVALRYPVEPGCGMESLLRYHRPLVEDGSIEYDFVYVPGKYEAHPALDRLVFLLDPDGVKVHWLTDGRFDRTLVPPDYGSVEPRNQRGPGQLPLKTDTWNHLKLAIEGRVASLELNGQLIYQRELESTNLRTFGVFHYSDRTDLQVRHVRMRGDWPKSLPSIQEQELADPQLVELQANLKDLPVEFHHDFTHDGLPEKLFVLREPQLDSYVSIEDDGVHVKFQADAGWKNLALLPRFSLEGDFDVRAHFELYGHFQPEWVDGLAFLEVQLADEENYSVRAMRGREPGGRQATRAQVMWGPSGEHRKLQDYSQSSWSQSGCFRIARVGDRVYSLFAPADSESFRVMHVEQISEADVKYQGIFLELAMRDGGEGHVVWKDLSVSAEKIKFSEMPEP